MFLKSSSFAWVLWPLLFSSAAFAQETVTWSGNLYKRALEYKKAHASFSKAVCSPGSDSKYYEYLRQYRGSGYYLPLMGEDIDREVITGGLPLIKQKIASIEASRKRLEKLETLPEFESVAAPIQETLRNLLNYKKDFSRETSEEKKTLLRQASQKELAVLKKRYDAFVEQLFFLKSFNYPNDHLENRKQYELSKNLPGSANQKKANSVFFLRKIVEDGTFNSKQAAPDLFLRSTLDTIYIAIQEEEDFISENLRYDLEWTLNRVEPLLSRGIADQKERLREWETRTRASLDFYQEIVQEKNRKKAQRLVKEKNDATIRLREYVYQKQAQTYLWWKDKPELMRALFVLETILFNEVGRVDGEDALERADVAQIVLNRVNHPFYSSLDPNQQLVKLLGLSEEAYSKQKWLNTLFRVGEFSFTYHYIPSVVKIFCPDMSRLGKSLRDKNVKISLKALKEKRENFHALRYFSRVSMLGKIDMSTVWPEYEKYPERAGYELLNQRELARLFLAGKYQYLYSFVDPEGVSFQVLRIGDETYTARWEKDRPLFHKYRDPHLFKYFIKK